VAEDERLSSKDVISSGISVVVGASIIMIVFLSLMSHYYDYYHKIPQRLTGLSEAIGTRFAKENSANVTALFEMQLREIEKDAVTSLQYHVVSGTNVLLRENFKTVSKINPVGKAYYHVALINKDDIKNTKNLSTRPYYKDFIASANVWQSADSISYVMRPVVSIEDQSEEAVYIVNNSDDRFKGYRVGASQLKSIHRPILPFGYQFAIIDDTGEVWFHSEEGRATLENFFDVSRQVNDAKAAVLGRINAQGLVNYRDQGQLFNVRPIKGTNLSVLALYDISLLRTRVSEVLTLTCIAVIMAIVLMLVITVLSLIIRNPKLGLYRYDSFLFEFLTPKKKYRDIYILLSSLFFTILLIIATIDFFIPIEPTRVYIICLLLAIWAYLIVYYTLHPYRNKPDLKFRVRDLLLLSVIVILNFMMFKMNSNNYMFPIIILMLQLSCAFMIFRGQFYALPDKIKNICRYNLFKIHIAYRYWYSIFLFSWLLLVVIFPTYLIFKKTDFLIDTVWFKTDQMFMARKFMAKETALKNDLPVFEGLESEYKKLRSNHLGDGLYTVYRETENIIRSKDTHSDTIIGNSNFQEFLWHTRPIFDERVGKFQALVYQHAHDTSWVSEKKTDKLTVRYLNKEGAIDVNWRGPQEILKGTSGFLTLKAAGILLILSILFSLILFFVDRFFAFRFRHLKPNDFDTNQKENYVKKFGRMLLDEKSNSGLLLIGLPFSGKRTFAIEILKSAGYTKDVTLSMLRLDHVDIKAGISDILNLLAGFTLKEKDQFDWEDHEVFIIEHLEHNIKSFNANHIKLKVISFLISKRKRVVLISEVFPSQIFAFYENPKQESSLPMGSLEDDFNSWRNILSAFPQVLIGITENTEKVYRVLGIKPQKNPTKYEVTITPLIEELGHSKFLPTLAPIILSKTLYTTENPNEKYEQLDIQRMVMHTQNLGHGYYNDIWNALPTRERYLLFDLAKDGFLNIKNRNSLFSLMKKGLVVWKNRPAIFNYSFKNFVITSVSMNEALRLENKNRGKGTWANIRIVFYLMIIATIVFIALGKPELIKDFEALVGTLGGLGVVIPLVSRFLASGGQK
ncbi:hypothetical protein LCGC14_1424870, partial [marine sediment metagenome]